MDAESFTQAIQQRDALIEALRAYAEELEALLAEKRANIAADEARENVWKSELEQARYKHGLRIDLTLR